MSMSHMAARVANALLLPLTNVFGNTSLNFDSFGNSLVYLHVTSRENVSIEKIELSHLAWNDDFQLESMKQKRHIYFIQRGMAYLTICILTIEVFFFTELTL